MANPLRPDRSSERVDFAIVSPQPVPPPGNSVTADGMGMITVTIDDNGSADDFAVSIYLFAVGSGMGLLESGPSDFPDHNISNMRSLSVQAGPIALPIPSGNNRIVQVEDKDSGRVIGHPFQVVPPGSSGSGSSGIGQTKQFQAKFCRPGQLVPIALMLKLDAKVIKGTCAKCSELNRPTLLLHSDDAKLAHCWLSRPIPFCGKGAQAGYWGLQRNSATAWTLTLQQGDKVVVTFTTKTKPKDCSLPIKLNRKGTGSKVCKAWPKTVTISPAS